MILLFFTWEKFFITLLVVGIIYWGWFFFSFGMYYLVMGYYADNGDNGLFLVPGIIIIITTFITGIYVYSKSSPSLEVKKNYMNLKWLNRQYYELGRSLQDIADDQGVSMMTIKKWVDNLDRISVGVDAKE